eukprot:5546282-Prymnesium_polylepis.1
MCMIGTPEANDGEARMAAHSMLAEHGGAVGKMSLAVEAERLLSDPLRAQGVKGESDKKRFAQAKMKERHYHVQDPSKVKFTGLSMTAVGFEKGEHNGLLAHYHLRADPDLGVGWVMVRRIPCACNPCLTQLDLPWSNGVERSKQPRYGPSTRCEKFEMFKQADGSSLNDWRLIQLVPKKESDPDEEVEAHDEVLMSMATMAAERVQVGGYGALATEDADGYYIFKWTSEPYTQQEDVELTQFTPAIHIKAGELVSAADYYNKVHRSQWYTPTEGAGRHTIVRMQQVVAADLKLEPISAENPLPAGLKKSQKQEMTRKSAVKLSKEEDAAILEEIHRREVLEHEEEESDEEGSDDEEDGEEEGSDDGEDEDEGGDGEEGEDDA